MELGQIVVFVGQVMALVAFVLLIYGVISYLWPRTPVGKANERYTGALEGENDVNRRTIARLEAESADLTRQLEAALSRSRQLELDVAAAKADNDRLRYENTRLRELLAKNGIVDGKP